MSVGAMADELAKLFFVYTPPGLILNGTIQDRRFPETQFEELMRCYMKNYSGTESKLIYRSRKIKENSVYDPIVQIGEELLTVKNNRICCSYGELLRWREVTRYLGEDLLICGFLAGRTADTGKRWQDFCWPLVTGNDNKQLNAILKEGLSDNHFHLFGSAPIFPLAWIRLMNDVRHGKYTAGLMGIKSDRRNFQYHLGEDYEEYSPNILILQAALMRALMFSYLRKDRPNEKQIQHFLSFIHMGSSIVHEEHEISDFIDSLKLTSFMLAGEDQSDYLLEDINDRQRNLEGIFGGERKLVYQMLCDILIYHTIPEEVQSLLYPYLVIRTWFRSEMVQNNDNVGFDNFQSYSRRKRQFLQTEASGREKCRYWTEKERRQNFTGMVKHAVLESFYPGNLQSLEVRISPCDDYKSDVEQIRCLDRVIHEEGLIGKEKFFYVYHFVKNQDITRSEIPNMFSACRHDRLRRKLEKQAEAIRKARLLYPEEGSRIRGIDACAKEIGCRPEVFACVFRDLKMETISSIEKWYEELAMSGRNGERLELPQLAVTYHAGEDFLDAVDGLRALDEAIRFFEMGRGDRLGHATVLGLSLEKWYERKGYRIYLPMQDYLDNVVWFYYKIIEYRLDGCEILKDYLVGEFQTSFSKIYVDDRGTCQTDMLSYYNAWKLRGDEPAMYKSGRFVPYNSYECSQSRSCVTTFPESREIREDGKAAELYYRYHYDDGVKQRGEQPIECSIPLMYVRGVVRLQKMMQKEIAKKGIGIETNPSSNLAISTMDNYAEHPILNLYTMGLEDQRECAQMFVSINTDDRGVFHTSLENEYALLASSVEQMKDEFGNNVYNPQNVYDWLNRIRIMGNQQVF